MAQSWAKKVIVSCPQGNVMKMGIQDFCQRFDIELVHTVGEVTDAILRRMDEASL